MQCKYLNLNKEECEKYISNVRNIKDKIINIYSKINTYEHEICDYRREINKLEIKIKDMFPKKWYMFRCNFRYRMPGVCKVDHITITNSDIIIHVLYRVKKNNKRYTRYEEYDMVYTLEEFKNMNIFKTKEEAIDEFVNIIFSRDGYIRHPEIDWYEDYMSQRSHIANVFEERNTFYYPKQNTLYRIEYEDEFSCNLDGYRGFLGKSFVIKRLDTNEIINTNNLWDLGYPYGRDNDIFKYPKIEFIGDEP